MAEEHVYRRRRRRRGRRGGRDAAPREREAAGLASAGAKPGPAPPSWQWRTFPVFFAFALGIVIMWLAFAAPGLSVVVFFVGLFGVAFGLAHIVTRAIVARRRRS